MVMLKRKRKLWYAWRENGQFRLSIYPPDMPYRPSTEFRTARELQLHAERKRADIYWWQQPWTVTQPR